VNPIVSFSVLRIALLAAVLAVLYAVGLRGVALLLVTAVVSLALSYLLLARPRAAVVRQIEERASARGTRGGKKSDDETAEDREVDEGR
jgi:hypothetical protein